MPILKKLEELSDNMKQYLLLNVELVKLEAVKQLSAVGSTLLSSLLVGISVFLFVFTLSIGLGFYLSALFGDTYSGFAIIAAFYLLLSLTLLIGKKKLLGNRMRNTIIRKLLEDKE
ncbi:MAG: phage holin family protein [Paludibacter sp.]|nr:phage holin family protein [Paludibacter sp.]